MKILIFGIDGLGEQSLKALRLNRLARRMAASKVANPSISKVISRGWTELYSGLDAYTTGAFYQIPIVINRQIVPTQKTGLSCVKEHIPNYRLIWNLLNRRGLKCGIFSVPTTNFPEKIDGFFVSATGAGKFGNSLGKEDVYPPDLLNGLGLENLDLGLRMGYGAFIPNNLDQLEKRANKHLADFFFLLQNLIDRHPLDVCFAASRFLNEMSYKFIKLYMDEPKSDYEKKAKSLILSLANNFDLMLDNFISSVNTEHLFIVSDHGIGPFEYQVNLNEILSRCGYINPAKSDLKNFTKKIKRFLYQTGGKLLGKKFGPSFPSYDLNQAQFFSIGFTDAIYIRDERFNGPAISQVEAFKNSEKAVKKLNQFLLKNHLADKMAFEALNLTKYCPSSIHKDVGKIPLPNIICHMKDGCANLERTNREIIRANHCSFGPELFRNGFFGEYSGIKTQDTIALYQGPNADTIQMDDLTKVYYSIANISEKYILKNDKS